MKSDKLQLSAIVDELYYKLDQQIQIIKKAELACIELRYINKKNILLYSKKEIKEFRNILQRNKINVSAICTTIGKKELKYFPNFQAKRLIKKAVKYALILKCSNIRIFSSHKNNNINFEKLLQVALNINPNINICFENEVNTNMDTYKAITEFASLYGVYKNFSVMLDTGNLTQTSSINMLKAYKGLSNYIQHIHIKDYNKKMKKTVSIGKGDANIQNIIVYLKKENKLPFITFEPKLKNIKNKETFFFENINRLKKMLYEN